MTVPLLDLTRQYCQIKDEVKPIVDSIMESQRFVNGPIVREFEGDNGLTREMKNAQAREMSKMIHKHCGNF
tara:strand:+ start:5700 stop:5912 length:213 start_codon:yes stop_codon:yes gene_type:complete